MNLALVGATGVVGEQILEQLAERSFPAGKLRLFASEDSVGNFVDFATESLPLGLLDGDAFADVDLVVFATPAEVSMRWMPLARRAGAICVDLSAANRHDGEHGLIVAGVNDETLGGAQLCSPASLVIQLARLIRALEVCGQVEDVYVTALSPATSAGRAGFAELHKQAGELLNGRPAQHQVFPAQLAFNCLPGAEDGASLERELRRVLALSPQLPIRINRMLVPLFYGEGAYLRVLFDRSVDAEALRNALQATNGLELVEGEDVPGPLDAVGSDALLVSLCGPRDGESSCVDLWFAADNAGGAAANAVSLVEMLASRID